VACNIGNTDDHLKNFSMLHKETGFCLSPAYDLLPDIHGKRSHSLSFPEGAG
jgi:serine/threonine-protein kinase HipA